MIDDQIAYLYSTVNAQDDKPNQGVYDRHDDLKKELNVLLSEFESILNNDVRPFNTFLSNQGMKIIMEF